MLANLNLNDQTIDLLQRDHFNNHLLCDIIKYPNFLNLMADTRFMRKNRTKITKAKKSVSIRATPYALDMKHRV